MARLGKAQVKQFATPTLSSFNTAALAWEEVQKVEALDQALHQYFAYAAREIADHLTDDPAGVSAPIRLPEGLRRETIMNRLQRAADGLDRAGGAWDS
ncbi:MAG: hypothetical protein L0Z47_04610 [Actinobacteria bacterium]|nr:hypothetical protein [Actinomycetota bacterium]